MTVREFAMVACKIVGLSFMLIGLAGLMKVSITLIGTGFSMHQINQLGQIQIPSVGATFGCSMLWGIFSVVISPVIELCIGFYVWSAADAIAARITRDDS